MRRMLQAEGMAYRKVKLKHHVLYWSGKKVSVATDEWWCLWNKDEDREGTQGWGPVGIFTYNKGMGLYPQGNANLLKDCKQGDGKTTLAKM